MELSKAGAGFIASFEGIILEGYPDPGTGGAPWTIGIGHTDAAGGPTVRRGDIWPLSRAFDVFADDARRFEARVNRFISRPMPQPDFDMLASFDFNTGAIDKGSVDDRYNRGDRDGAITTLGQYTRAAGRILPGLVTRRNAEMQVMRTGRYPSRKILVKDRYRSQGWLMDASAIVWRGEVKPVPVVDIDKALPPIVMSPQPVSFWASVGKWIMRFFA